MSDHILDKTNGVSKWSRHNPSASKDYNFLQDMTGKHPFDSYTGCYQFLESNATSP